MCIFYITFRCHVLFDVCTLNIKCMFCTFTKFSYANLSQCGDTDFLKFHKNVLEIFQNVQRLGKPVLNV